MQEKNFVQLLVSIPVILLTLYFIPFLGTILLIVRLFMVPSKKRRIPLLIVIGVILLIPYGLIEIPKSFNIGGLESITDFVSDNIPADKLFSYGKRLIIFGVIFSILSYYLNKAVSKINEWPSQLSSKFDKYIQEEQNKTREIEEKNDLIMKEKREKAKNSRIVKCPSCGHSNLVTSTTGICKYCRNPINNTVNIYQDEK